MKRIFAALAILGAATTARATTYTYTGPTYTTLANFTPPCGTGPCANYTGSMKITGWFTTATPLAANLAVASDITTLVTSFSFNDGLQAISSSDLNTRRGGFLAQTDAAGNIVPSGSTFIVMTWQTGSRPHALSDRWGAVAIKGTKGTVLAVRNMPCEAIGVSPAGDADTCTSTGINADSSASSGSSFGPLGQWSPAAFDASALFVPIVLSSAGIGSFFTTELALTNRGTTDATITYAYTAAFGGSSGTATDTLPAGMQKTYTDTIATLRGLGIPLGESGNRGGTLRVTFNGLSSPSAGAATVRTATPVADGRAGLAYAGLPSTRLLSAPVYLCGLRQNSFDRSNVAVMNAGATADGEITLRLTVVSGDPANPNTQVLPGIPLLPGGFSQVSGILGSVGLSNGYVKVERVSGSAPFYTYGVINDQVNSDGSFVEPVLASPAAIVPAMTLPVVVETSAFSTELVLTNLSTVSRTLRFTYVAAALPGGTATFNIALLPNEQQILPAFVQVLRERGVVSGAPGPTFAGALFATDATGDLRGVSIGARTSSPGGGGRYGLFYSAVPAGSEATTSAWLYGLQQNGENRTNLALVNVGSVDGSSDVFHIDLYDGATGQKAGSTDLTVPAKGFFQIGTILAAYAPGATGGYALVTRTSGNNPWIAYAVINDGGQPGQRSGDGAFVSAVVEPGS